MLDAVLPLDGKTAGKDRIASGGDAVAGYGENGLYVCATLAETAVMPVHTASILPAK